MHKCRMGSNAKIPVVDISAFASRALGPDAKAQAEALRSACSDVGFVYIKGHGCPEDLISKTFAATKAFFDLPSIEKKKLLASNSRLYRGYNAVGGRIRARPKIKIMIQI